MEIYNAKLQSEYYPNVIRELPLDMPLRYTLLELIILERKFNKYRGNHFNTTAEHLAKICSCTVKQMRSYLTQLKQKRIIDYERSGHVTYYCINWEIIGRFLNKEHLK